MAERKATRPPAPPAAPLDFTEEQIERARAGQGKQVFEEALAQRERATARARGAARRTRRTASP
jgi:hypothetical protein